MGTSRSCRVTITDMEGVAHTVEVTAASLFEAVALGLVALRGERRLDDPVLFVHTDGPR